MLFSVLLLRSAFKPQPTVVSIHVQWGKNYAGTKTWNETDKMLSKNFYFEEQLIAMQIHMLLQVGHMLCRTDQIIQCWKGTDLLQGSIQNRTACIRNLPFHSNVNEVIQYKLIFVSVDIIKLFGLTLTLISGNIKE